MFNERVKEFNIISFVIKAVLVVFALAVSFFVLVLSEQFIVAMRGVPFRCDYTNSLIRFNDKNLERLVSSITPNLVVVKILNLTLTNFITFFFTGAFTAVSFLVLTILIGSVNPVVLKFIAKRAVNVSVSDISYAFRRCKVNSKLTI